MNNICGLTYYETQTMKNEARFSSKNVFYRNMKEGLNLHGINENRLSNLICLVQSLYLSQAGQAEAHNTSFPILQPDKTGKFQRKPTLIRSLRIPNHIQEAQH